MGCAALSRWHIASVAALKARALDFDFNHNTMRRLIRIVIIIFVEIVPFIVSAQTDSSKTDSSTVGLPGVVVSASRRKEQILQAPVSVEKMDVNSIRQSAQPSFFDAIENIKKAQKNGLSEDASKDAENDIQELTDRYISLVDKHLSSKEKDIMAV